MEKNNMTAVEWFFEVLAHNDIIDHKRLCVDENLYNLLYSLKNQAKQMEKEQMKESWFDSTLQFDNAASMVYKKEFEQYYNETFGNK